MNIPLQQIRPAPDARQPSQDPAKSAEQEQGAKLREGAFAAVLAEENARGRTPFKPLISEETPDVPEAEVPLDVAAVAEPLNPPVQPGKGRAPVSSDQAEALPHTPLMPRPVIDSRPVHGSSDGWGRADPRDPGVLPWRAIPDSIRAGLQPLLQRPWENHLTLSPRVPDRPDMIPPGMPGRLPIQPTVTPASGVSSAVAAAIPPMSPPLPVGEVAPETTDTASSDKPRVPQAENMAAPPRAAPIVAPMASASVGIASLPGQSRAPFAETVPGLDRMPASHPVGPGSLPAQNPGRDVSAAQKATFTLARSQTVEAVAAEKATSPLGAVVDEAGLPLPTERSAPAGPSQAGPAATPQSPTPQTPPETARQVAGQIALAISRSAGGGTEITLNPEELGRVRLNIAMSDGALTLMVSAERPETTDLMRRNIDALAQEFRALGFADLSFAFGGDQSAGRQGQTAQDRAVTGKPVRTVTAAEVAPATGPAATARLDGSGGQLDLRL